MRSVHKIPTPILDKQELSLSARTQYLFLRSTHVHEQEFPEWEALDRLWSKYDSVIMQMSSY